VGLDQITVGQTVNVSDPNNGNWTGLTPSNSFSLSGRAMQIFYVPQGAVAGSTTVTFAVSSGTFTADIIIAEFDGGTNYTPEGLTGGTNYNTPASSFAPATPLITTATDLLIGGAMETGGGNYPTMSPLLTSIGFVWNNYVSLNYGNNPAGSYTLTTTIVGGASGVFYVSGVGFPNVPLPPPSTGAATWDILYMDKLFVSRVVSGL
jgi:hypothetical protein